MLASGLSSVNEPISVCALAGTETQEESGLVPLHDIDSDRRARVVGVDDHPSLGNQPFAFLAGNESPLSCAFRITARSAEGPHPSQLA